MTSPSILSDGGSVSGDQDLPENRAREYSQYLLQKIENLEAELQSLREREEWRTDLENVPLDGKQGVLLAVEVGAESSDPAWKFKSVGTRTAIGRTPFIAMEPLPSFWTHFMVIPLPSPDNTDTQAPLRERLRQLEKALQKAALRFREYENGHTLKGTADGDMKAKRNGEMVDMCEEALDAKALAGGGSQ